jgi:chemotaxis methyl-accepting protein methylase
MSTSSSTTTAEELIAENITMNDAKDVFLKSIERLSSDDRLTQKAMAKALGLNRTTFMRKAKRWDITITTVLPSIPTETKAASFMKVIERLPSEDRLSRTTMIKALSLSSATFYRKVKEYGIKLNDFVVDKKRKRVEEKEQKVSQCNTN